MPVENSDPQNARELLENFDIEDAIEVVRELGEGLIGATAHARHHFRTEWVDQLVCRYRERPGKPVVHLSDLPDQVIPILSHKVRPFLQPHWQKLVAKYGSEWGSRHFRCIWDIMKMHEASRWSSLRSWKAFSGLTGLPLNELEPFTIALRAASTGTSRIIKNPKLPFELATTEGAKLFGYRGDAEYGTSALVNVDSLLHDDYRRAILATLVGVRFTTSVIHQGSVKRTNVGVFVTLLTSLGGLDNTKRQKFVRNPIPSWFFVGNDEVSKSCLRSLWDAEGSPTRDALKLGQSVDNPALRGIRMPRGHKRTRLSYFSRNVQEAFTRLPPLLLVSASLLLFKLGIISYLVPLGIEETQSGTSAVWMLVIYRTRNMRAFEEKIGFLSLDKMEKLARLNSIHKPRPLGPSTHSDADRVQGRSPSGRNRLQQESALPIANGKP